MKKTLLSIAFIALTFVASATITIVDINGAGQFTSIQLAINNANAGDTIQVWPGTYNEAININKNVVLQGSGYESTILTGAFDPTIIMSNGLLKWISISSTLGTGIKITSGRLYNCVVKSCAGNGIYCLNGNGVVYIQNCIVLNCGGAGIIADGSTSNIVVTNTISRNNTGNGFYLSNNGLINKSYCNGSNGCNFTYCGVSNNQGCIDSDPIFISTTNYHLSSGSPCFDTGQPSLADPDGSQSDMGYFGGPDCPIFPVVYQMTITPNGNNINVQAKARANY
jgi:hypothetical protein